MGTIQEIDWSQSSGPKYRVLAQRIEASISDGSLKTGEKMPPVRDLAWDLKVTPGTVARAYQWLIDRNVLNAKVGSGTFVSLIDRGPTAGESLMVENVELSDDVLDMRSPILPDVGQVEHVRQGLLKAAEMDEDMMLLYPDMSQSRELRKLILHKKIKSFETAHLSPDHMVLTHGGQHAISLILQTVLKGPKPVVLTEELAYPGFRHAIQQMRGRAVAIEQDKDGPVPASIRAACQAHDVQLLATSGFAHNPTTISTTPERRAEIAELAREFDFHIIDDQSYGLVRVDRPSYRDLAPDRVWFISSLSKSIAPNLRFGWFVTPDGWRNRGQRAASHSSFGVSKFIMTVAEHVMSHPDADRVRDAVASDNAARVEIMREVFAGYDLHTRPDVAFAYLAMPSGWRASNFQRKAEDAGILLRNADAYVLVDGRAPNAVRLAVNSRVSRERFRRGCQVLRDLLDNPPHEIGV
ncbi:hypothetical protein ACMU_07280 [Actibacterium mucosum KCTC 23349]|uniref:HTH gntR-type domain-containing protein n=1 Tax=Actibacterium mucosum KCTC 23349 TaxID=1454373 RepID=A0A037ZKV4_9RHOB|nr:PLP-dependent aminotransferase family protein [Actibacterium mucosum]KAJ56733.1 hypothetical protein ACMU_07280 [Actibacterium mucosum KCTC 23349]